MMEEVPENSKATTERSKVIYIGHLPHGFYEKQLEGFFSQFGTVTRLRVSRSKKTGKSKHYAFIEFKLADVAAIAAEAMDGYMMFAQKLDCHLMSPKEIHKDLFKGANKKFKAIPWKTIETKRHDKIRSSEEQMKRITRAVAKDQSRSRKLKDLGIEYDYEVLEKESKASKHTKF